MEKWSMLAGRCDGLVLWDRQGNRETHRLAAERGTAKKHVLPELSWLTGTKSYQGTCVQAIWALSESWIQLRAEKREENFPSDFRLPVWAGAEVARNKAKQREPTQRSGFGACHKCWGDCRLPAVPHPCREQLGRGSTSCLGKDGGQPFALLAGNKASSHRITEWRGFPSENAWQNFPAYN